MIAVTIKKVPSGYVLVRDDGRQYVHRDLDSALDDALSTFEGRCEVFKGAQYGRVLVVRELSLAERFGWIVEDMTMRHDQSGIAPGSYSDELRAFAEFIGVQI